MFKRKGFWVAALIFGIIVSVVAINVWTYKDVSANEDYSDLNILMEVMKTIKQNYVEEPKTKDLVYGAIKGMVASLDPHSGFMPPDAYKEMQVDTSGEFGGLGIQIGMKDGWLTVIAPMDDTPASKAGILAGDKIVKINGVSTKDMQIFDAVNKMRGPKGTPVVISIMREGWKEPRDFKLIRDIITVKSVKYKMLDKDQGIGYVKLSQFQEKTAEELAAALKDLKAQGMRSLILDLRNNPGGLLNSSVDVVGQFIAPGKLVVSIKGRVGPRQEYHTSAQYPTYENIPMVVLVNQGSASASEIVAGAMKDWQRAIILGTRTFGKGSVQTVIPLSDGSGLRLTTARYYTPKDISIQNTGITPDIEVKLAMRAANGKKLPEHPFIREKDLRNHLDAKPGEKNLEDEDSTYGGELAPITPLKEKDDTQLQRAMDVLKTWGIFRKTETAAAKAS